MMGGVKMFSNMKLDSKMYAGYAVILVFTVFMGVFAIIKTKEQKSIRLFCSRITISYLTKAKYPSISLLFNNSLSIGIFCLVIE
jgi:hypothetical protein